MSAKATTATPQSTAKTPAAATPAASAAETQPAERALGNRSFGQLRNSVQISRPNDADEREADRIAAQVMARTFDGEIVQRPGATSVRLQRKCKGCEDEEPRIRRKAAQAPDPGAGLQSRLDGFRDRGRPLPGNVLSSMGSAFGADLSGVRIHTGDYAAGLSQELGAQAFTYGADIYFNRGKFDPGSMAGRHLLAHELTHTLQQDGMIRLKPQCLMTDWFEEIDKQIGGKHWGKTDQEKEEIRKRVKALPDANKLKVREMIDECIGEGIGIQTQNAEDTLAWDKAKLPAHRKKVQDLCDTGVKNIRDFRRKAGAAVLQERGDELDKREQLLLLMKQAMNDDRQAADDFSSFGAMDNKESANEGLARQLGNAPQKLRMEGVDLFIYLFSLAVNHGFGSYAAGIQAWFIYSGYFSFTPSDLRTSVDKPPDVTAAPGGGTSPGTQPPPGGATTTPPATTAPAPAPDAAVKAPDLEELAKIREFLQLLEKSDLPGEHADMEALAKLLKDLSKEDLEAFKEFYKEYVVQHDEEKEGALTVEKALEKFLAMSELDRETLRTNRALKERDETAPGPTAERIKLCEDKTDEAQQSFEELNKQLEQVQNMPGDAGRKGEFAPLDGSMLEFLDEMSILDGLIDGASRKSTDIAEAAQGFWSELDRFRENLITEMQWLAARIAAEAAAGFLLSYLSFGTAAPVVLARIALLVKKLNDLRKLLQRVRRIIAIFDTFTEIIDAVSAAGQAYETFNREFGDGLRRLRVMQQRMESLAGEESLDEEYEQLQEELMEKIQAQLDGNLGELLQHFFIPPDTSEDELLMILTDIPEGIDSLKRVYERYQRGKGKASAGEFAQTLYVMSTEAGFKLYPLVGFLTAKAGEALNSFNAELEGKSVADRMSAGLDRLVTKSRSHRNKSAADRKSGIRGLFEKIRPKRYDYNEADIKAVLKKGEEWMNTEFDKMNKDADNTESFNGFWTKALFRFTVRNKVKELNAVRSTFGDVRATLKGKKKGAANPEMKVTPPKFKVKWSSMFSRDKNFYFYLTLNPTSNKIPKILAKPLTYTSFKGKGIPFTSKDRKKKDALHDWLDEEGYVITRKVKNRDFVRHSSRGTGPYGKTWYLQVDHDESTPRIKQDQKLTVTQKYIPDFYGRLVSDDQDLPEGYVLYTAGKDEGIRARKGIALLLKKFPLGLDADGKIVGEDKKFPVVETKTEKKAENYENIVNPESMADKMFEADKVTPNPEYKVKDQSYEWWRKHIRKQGELQQRPTFKHYILGNVKYARSVGDLLGGRTLPELKHGDDRGHLIAKRFGGSDDYNNLIPMKANLNRGNQQGSWYNLEGDLAKEFRRGHKKVEVKINIEYPSPKSRRPHRFHGSYDVLKFDASTKTWGKDRSGSFPKGLKQ